MEELLEKLLMIDSTTEKGVRECMALIEASTNLSVLRSESPLFLILGRGDLLHPDVGILCHLDTVPPFFQPRKEGGKMFGRGAIDMKGPAVASLQAVVESGHPNVAIAFTGDEEVGGKTAKHLATKFKPKVLIVPDQNRGFGLSISSKGVFHAKLHVKGSTGHASRPESGDNAVEKLVRLASAIKKAVAPDSFNLAFVACDNRAFNVIPGSAVGGIDIRTTREIPEVRKIIRHLAKKHKARLEVVATGTPIKVAMTADFKRFRQIILEVTGHKLELVDAAGSCDARHFMGVAETLLITKPDGSDAHVPDECITLKSMAQLKEVIRVFLTPSHP